MKLEMSGHRYLLDTNVIVFLLRGELENAEEVVNASWLGISIVSYLEFLSFPHLSADDIKLFGEFVEQCEVVSLDLNKLDLLNYVVNLRKRFKLKLPDAIILASAINSKAQLLTFDKELQKKYISLNG